MIDFNFEACDIASAVHIHQAIGAHQMSGAGKAYHGSHSFSCLRGVPPSFAASLGVSSDGS